jgi:hypothetical protein
MDRDRVMRLALRATCALNFGAAFLFLFPDSLGRLAGFPGPASALHRVFVAFMVALFGATYGWLARRPRIDRPLVAFCALGKAGFFTVAFGCWLFGELPGRGAFTASGDLVFAAIFVWWLAGGSPAAAES